MEVCLYVTQCFAITCGVFISRALPTQTKCQRHTGTSEWDSDVGGRVGDRVTEETDETDRLSLSLSRALSRSRSLARALSLSLSGMYVCKCV